MTRIVFIEASGREQLVEAENGRTLMQVAVDHLVPGIVADCGGCCTCATCHAYIDPAWLDKLHAPSEDETMMLEGVLELQPNSRLSCQILVKPELDGMVVRTPKRQF